MGRILALDVGEKTLGVAFCEEGQMMAFPGKTLWRQEGHRRDMAALRQLIVENDVREIVVGLPLLPDGTRGVQVEKIEQFVQRLRNSVRIPIHFVDERFSTWEAEQILLEAGKRRENLKQTVDSVAASLILQSYLERRSAEKKPGEREE